MTRVAAGDWRPAAVKKGFRMYAKGSRKGTVKFTLQGDKNTKKVAVAGSFSEWEPVDLKKGKDGSFSAVVAIKPGCYEYKFIVDGDWKQDADVPAAVQNRFGTFNSVLVLE
jgi:1,4-alpha-glucan branching enzyme